MRTLLLVAALIGLAACDIGPAEDRLTDSIDFETAEGPHRPGDAVDVTLYNGLAVAVGHNLCFAFLDLERRTTGGWVNVAATLGPADIFCDSSLSGLSPGATIDGRATLPDTLAPGTYRLATDVEIWGVRNVPDHARVATNGFTVE